MAPSSAAIRPDALPKMLLIRQSSAVAVKPCPKRRILGSGYPIAVSLPLSLPCQIQSTSIKPPHTATDHSKARDGALPIQVTSLTGDVNP